MFNGYNMMYENGKKIPNLTDEDTRVGGLDADIENNGCVLRISNAEKCHDCQSIHSHTMKYYIVIFLCIVLVSFNGYKCNHRVSDNARGYQRIMLPALLREPGATKFNSINFR